MQAKRVTQARRTESRRVLVPLVKKKSIARLANAVVRGGNYNEFGSAVGYKANGGGPARLMLEGGKRWTGREDMLRCT